MRRAGAEICAAISKPLLLFLGAGEGTRRGKSCFQRLCHREKEESKVMV